MYQVKKENVKFEMRLTICYHNEAHSTSLFLMSINDERSFSRTLDQGRRNVLKLGEAQ